jgi:hypothetical protein
MAGWWSRRRRASRVAAGAAVALVLCSAGRARGDDSPLLPRPSLGVLETALQEPSPPPAGLPAAGGRPSLAKAILFSALVPGLGEFYSGHTYRGLGFATVEAGIWITYATFEVQENLRAERAVEYAVSVAGAVPDGDDDYYSAMAQFLRSDGPGQWNEYVRRKRRDGEDVGVEYVGDAGWAWPSDQHFLRYRDLRRGQLEAADNATDMLAVALINRIASIVDVVAAMRSDAHKREEAGFGLKFQLGRAPGEPLARLTLQNRF